MTEKEKMLAGQLYMANDDELRSMFQKCRRLLDEFNQTLSIDFEKRREISKELFGAIGNNFAINKPFYCDYGANIYIGDYFYANFDLIILDVNKVIIGNNVMFGPRVSIYTAGHPIDKDVRNTLLEFGKQVTIGNDVWIGGSVTINPGVNIGDNVVIGSGSVVTKDIPANCIAVGNPCKVVRKITDADKRYWEAKKEEYYQTK